MRESEDKMSGELRRLRRMLFAATIAGLVGVLAVCVYFILAERFAFLHTRCAFSRLLHLYCPGCGGTRAVKALLTGHPLRSLVYNPIVLWLIVLAVAQYVRALIALHRREPSRCAVPAWSWISVIVLLLVVFVIRNLLLVFCGIDTLGEHLAFWNAVMGR